MQMITFQCEFRCIYANVSTSPFQYKSPFLSDFMSTQISIPDLFFYCSMETAKNRGLAIEIGCQRKNDEVINDTQTVFSVCFIVI